MILTLENHNKMSNILIFQLLFYNIYLSLVNSTDSNVLYKYKTQVFYFKDELLQAHKMLFSLTYLKTNI